MDVTTPIDIKTIYKAYDPNEDAPKDGAKLPSSAFASVETENGLGAYVRLAEQVIGGEAPQGTFLERVMQDYQKAVTTGWDEFIKKAGGAVSKAIDVPGQFLTFARMAYMPDSTSSNILPWPGVHPEALRKIVMENVAPNLVIGMRVDDVMNYSQQSAHLWKPGWRIETKTGDASPSAEDKKGMREAEEYLFNSATKVSYTQQVDRDKMNLTDFQHFLGAIVRDSLTFDLIAVSTDRDQSGRVVQYGPVPAGNIRLVGLEGYEANKEIYAVAVDEGGAVRRTYRREDLALYIRNARTDPEYTITMTRGYGTPEITTALKLIQIFQNVLDFNADVFQRCYSEDTEVLTKGGWKYFNDVDIKTDEFATLNLETSLLEYQKATDRIWHDYAGEMYRLQSRSLDFLVTPKHRIVTKYRPSVGTRYEGTYLVSYAEDLYSEFQGMEPKSRDNYALPAISKWEGCEIGERGFAKEPKRFSAKPRVMSGDDYCAFMGMYLSEGNLFRDDPEAPFYNIAIHQHEHSRGFLPFQELLGRIFGRELTYNEGNNRWNFGWWGLAEHLAQFGRDCYTKTIPQDILDASPRQQKIFWDYYVLGDGTVTQGHDRIITTSRKMADQLQELAQKMGYAATINVVADPNKYDRNIGGVIVKSRQPRYTVCLKTSPLQSMDMEKVEYQGKIGCVTVPNGTLYVRRNGKAIWSGNSGVPHGMMVLTGSGWTQKQVDVLTRMWHNLKRGISKALALPVLAAPKDGKVELVDFSRIKGDEAFYQDLLNLSIGCFCAVFRFPVHRIGYRVSGKGKDTSMSMGAQGRTAPQLHQEDDKGLTALLLHIENFVNQVLIWPRWAGLKFVFTGKNPREDVREYEARRNALTYDEARAEADLPKLVDLEGVKGNSKLKELAEAMGLAPIDPNLSGVYQTLSAAMLAPDDVEEGKPGNTMSSKKDPAVSEQHGGISGARRDSKSEKKGVS